MMKPLRFENRRLQETLGWAPPFDYQQCLARTYDPAVTIAAACRGAGSLAASNGRFKSRTRSSKSS
jgi:hypothetical protein